MAKNSSYSGGSGRRSRKGFLVGLVVGILLTGVAIGSFMLGTNQFSSSSSSYSLRRTKSNEASFEDIELLPLEDEKQQQQQQQEQLAPLSPPAAVAVMVVMEKGEDVLVLVRSGGNKQNEGEKSEDHSTTLEGAHLVPLVQSSEATKKKDVNQFLEKELNLRPIDLLFLKPLQHKNEEGVDSFVAMIREEKWEQSLRLRGQKRDDNDEDVDEQRKKKGLRLNDLSLEFKRLQDISEAGRSFPLEKSGINESADGFALAKNTLPALVKFLQPWVVTAGKAISQCKAMLE